MFLAFLHLVVLVDLGGLGVVAPRPFRALRLGPVDRTSRLTGTVPPRGCCMAANPIPKQTETETIQFPLQISMPELGSQATSWYGDKGFLPFRSEGRHTRLQVGDTAQPKSRKWGWGSFVASIGASPHWLAP